MWRLCDQWCGPSSCLVVGSFQAAVLLPVNVCWQTGAMFGAFWSSAAPSKKGLVPDWRISIGRLNSHCSSSRPSPSTICSLHRVSTSIYSLIHFINLFSSIKPTCHAHLFTPQHLAENPFPWAHSRQNHPLVILKAILDYLSSLPTRFSNLERALSLKWALLMISKITQLPIQPDLHPKPLHVVTRPRMPHERPHRHPESADITSSNGCKALNHILRPISLFNQYRRN